MCSLTDMFGGPSGSEIAASNQQGNIAKTMWTNFSNDRQNQMNTLDQYKSELGLIQSGNTGLGYGGLETAAGNTLIENNAAADARNALQATQDQQAGGAFGGGDTGLQSAQAQQAKETALLQANKEASNNKLQFLMQNLNQGRANAVTTASGLNTLAGEYGQSSQFSAGQSAQQNAAYLASQKEIQQQKGQEFSNMLSAATSVAGAFVPGAGGLLNAVKGGIGNMSSDSSFGENVGNFFSGLGGGTTGPGAGPTPAGFYGGANSGPSAGPGINFPGQLNDMTPPELPS